ncbi:Glycine betaine/carnitine transport binding protein GbuC precursor [compost metagenome]
MNEAQPEAYAFLDKFSWTPDDMAEVMIEIQEGAEPEAAAKAWVENNADKVDSWLK